MSENDSPIVSPTHKNSVVKDEMMSELDERSLISNLKTRSHVPVFETKKSLSSRFSEVDFQKQLKQMQDTKNSATALTKSSSVSNAMRETLLLPSLSHRVQDCDELNPGVYTSSYKQRVADLAQGVRIKINDAEPQAREVKLTHIKPTKQSLNSSEGDQPGELPELDRLIDLHRRYCNSSEKSIEELQRDLYCHSDDFYKLELFLQTGRTNYYWTEIEDMILQKHHDDSDEVKMLQRVKGPQEVMNRKFFLNLM